MNINKDFFKLPDKVFGMNISFLKLFIVPIVVFLVFVVSFNLVITPKFDQISKLNDSIKSVNKEIDLTVQKINYLSSVDQQQIKSDVGYLESAVLQERNSYLLLGTIRSVADKYNFGISSFSISSLEVKSSETLKVADKDIAVRMPIELKLIGPDSKRVELITALENVLPILFIDGLEISSSNGVSVLEMTVSSYYVADNGNSVKGNLSLSDLMPTEEENNLLKTISSFNKIDNEFSSDSSNNADTFVKYDRPNPFTL